MSIVVETTYTGTFSLYETCSCCGGPAEVGECGGDMLTWCENCAEHGFSRWYVADASGGWHTRSGPLADAIEGGGQ